jgi:hypothetical protein
MSGTWTCECKQQNPYEARFCGSCGRSRPASMPPPDPWIGKTILERYRVVSVIGEGAMGIVYRAEQRMGQAARKFIEENAHLVGDLDV